MDTTRRRFLTAGTAAAVLFAGTSAAGGARFGRRDYRVIRSPWALPRGIPHRTE